MGSQTSIKDQGLALFDAVKLLIPEAVPVAEFQLVENQGSEAEFTRPIIGSKLLIVGYAYGYSTFGERQPAAIVLTRFVAATRFQEKRHELLLDGDGAPGVSGGPVFIERDGQLSPIGIYRGNVRPSAEDFSVRLGTFADLQMCWRVPQLEFRPYGA